MEIINEEDYYASLSLPPLPPLSLRKNKLSKKKSTVCRLKKYKETKAERLLRALVTEVECVDLQNRLKQAIDDIITFFTENYDTLIDEFYELEHTKNELEYRLHIQSKHHERSLKEIQQFYKIQYENNPNMLFQQHGSRRSTASSILLPSNVSCISGRSYMSSSSARSSSCSSSMRTSFSHLMDEMIDPTMIREDSILLEKEENQHHPNEIDIYSVLSDSEAGHDPSNTTDSSKGDHTLSSLVQSPTVDDNELNTNNEISISKTKFENNNSEVTITTAKKEREEDALTFACGDGFWNTIARGKNNKTDVDTLISNYLRRGGNPNVAKNSETIRNVKEGYGLIHALIAIKNTSALQKVIAAGAKTSAIPLASRKEDRIAPLVLAAKLGYTTGARLLIEAAGSKIWMHDRGPYGENALHAAVQGGSEEMVSYLLRITDNHLLDLADDNGATPLHYACITGKTRILTLFIRDYQCQPDSKDNKGETPLHYAVRNRKLKVVIKLVGELGVYPNPYVPKQVPTPLDLAKSGGLKTIMEYLKSAGAKTTKEMEKSNRMGSTNSNYSQRVYSSNSSVFSGESSLSGDSTNHGPTSNMGSSVRQFLHSKTTQILKGTFDL